MPTLEELLLPIAVSNFKQFFKNVSVATPQQLNQTPSLHRLKGLTSLRRLTTYITRGGQFYKTMQVLLNAFSTLETDLKTVWGSAAQTFNWTTYYSTLVWFPHMTQGISQHPIPFLVKYSDKAKLTYGDLEKLTPTDINFLFSETFKRFNFLFSFYIYKVDKQIYKNSRGRSGKYTFVWKYVAPYKRSFLILHWLAREMRTHSGKTWQMRVITVLRNFFFNTTSTWIWKIKKFSLNYVYFNLRKTLGETYKTSMR